MTTTSSRRETDLDQDWTIDDFQAVAPGAGFREPDCDTPADTLSPIDQSTRIGVAPLADLEAPLIQQTADWACRRVRPIDLPDANPLKDSAGLESPPQSSKDSEKPGSLVKPASAESSELSAETSAPSSQADSDPAHDGEGSAKKSPIEDLLATEIEELANQNAATAAPTWQIEPFSEKLPSGSVGHLDDQLDPFDLPDFDPDAQADVRSVSTTDLREEARRRQLARALGRRHGWTSVSDLGILEGIVSPMRGLGRSLTSLDGILTEGITPEELSAAHRIRKLWIENVMWIDSRTVNGKSGLSQRFTGLSWANAWKIVAVLGCDLSDDEMQWTLDRLCDDWSSRLQDQEHGWRSAFEVGPYFLGYLLDRLVEEPQELPFWATENWVKKANLHSLHSQKDWGEMEGLDSCM